MYYHNDKEHIISCQAKTPNVINQKLIVYSTSTRSSGSAKKIIISKKISTTPKIENLMQKEKA
jgi:hypothetical protein